MHKRLVYNEAMEKIIDLDGEKWRVVGVGARRDGKVYCHLSSTTRFSQRKNGQCPIQIADFIDEGLLEAGA